MRKGLYFKLAVLSMKKSRKTYFPYLAACIGMVMMYYIITYLAKGQAVTAMRGGNNMQWILGFGQRVIAVFSVIFLFYTNSFLIRGRKKEFGLYNILGMGKKNLFRVLFWENVCTAAIAISGGLACGVLFSKLAELCMAKILQSDAVFFFTVEWGALRDAASFFLVIFFLILLNGIRQVHLAKPVELMNSEAAGEKPPKANWLLTLLGLVLLAGAYYMAISITDPMAAIVCFFIAVIIVIIATYFLFIAGSVALCKLLQKKKSYYYKTNHFVSLSSMSYRMKRNGAGLATVCILSTMVLVMISATVCLYIGKESSLRNRYPRNLEVTSYSLDSAHNEQVIDITNQAVKDSGLMQENVMHYRHFDCVGISQENQISFSQDDSVSGGVSYENISQLVMIPLEDYNAMTGEEENLEENEILLYSTKGGFDYDTLALEGYGTLHIKTVLPEFMNGSFDMLEMWTCLYVIVPELENINDMVQKYEEITQQEHNGYKEYYGFDLSCEDEEMVALYNHVSQQLETLQTGEDSFLDVECVAAERSGFYAVFGGAFFVGVLLGLVFVLAAVLIIYYKQISEGYEDQSRFQIMQKVGMTKKEIRKSINSQILTVFFLPLVAAGVHLAFAFPMIYKMLAMFALTDIRLFILVAIGCYLLFTLFYVLVYRSTSKAYYAIVSDK